MSGRDEFVKKLKVQLDEWNAELDRLDAKVRKATEGGKATLEKEIGELRSRRDDLKEKVGSLQQAGENAWEEVRKGIDEAADILRKSFESARSKFKE